MKRSRALHLMLAALFQRTRLLPESIVSRPSGCGGRGVRRGLALACLPFLAFAADSPPVCVVGADGAGELLAAVLRQAPEFQGSVRAVAPAREGGPGLAPLRTAQAAVFYRGPGALAKEDAAVLQEFLRAGKGCVVLGATAEAWRAVPGALAEQVGGVPGEPFAGGAPMTVINLYPHPIYAGVPQFETIGAMTAWTKLPNDAQMIMEGTVGEETTPLAWVRRSDSGRVCDLVPAGTELLADSNYQRIVTNALRWVLGRPIPGARPIVQRTFMPNSHPGAIAITFPEGPGVCLDPVRGGINFVWDGDFVDLRPRWLTKQGEPARIFGEIFYQENAWQPLRGGAPGGPPDFRFRGYVLKPDAPEFHYVVGGRDVFETIRAERGGLVRSFRVGPGQAPLWLSLEAQPGAEVTVRGLERDGDRGCFPATGAGEFTIEIQRKRGGLRR